MKNPTHPQFNAVMFDLDGTLVDSLDDIAAATNFIRNQMGYHDTLNRDTIRRYVGYGAQYLLEHTLSIGATNPIQPIDIQNGLTTFKKFYADRGITHTRTYDGITDMLDALESHQTTMAILSNKPHAAANLVVETLLPNRKFTHVFGQRDGIPPKPDPESALSITRQHNIHPAKWIYVGDSEVDIQTGRAAGMFTIAVTWGFRDRQTLADQQPDAIIDHPRQLLPYLIQS